VTFRLGLRWCWRCSCRFGTADKRGSYSGLGACVGGGVNPNGTNLSVSVRSRPPYSGALNADKLSAWK